MALTKYKLGDLLQLEDERNSDNKYTLDDVKGISVQKIFIETKADMQDVSLTPYILVKPDFFVYVTVTSRNGEKITLAHNTTKDTYIVSSSYVVFSIARKDLLNSDYLFMYFNRPEFDRFSRFNSWGSARETFSWEDLCDIDIELPSLSIQQKYVDVYNSMLANQKSYERGLEDLKLTCDATIEKFMNNYSHQKLGNYIITTNEINEDLKFYIDDVKGISNEKQFIETKADMNGVSLKPYLIVKPNEFAYVTVTSRNGEKISLARNATDNPCICSSSYIAFKIINTDKLIPEYLSMLFDRSEFNRYSRFNSWGSARETFDWEEMCEVKIPVPEVEKQSALVCIYNSYNERKSINEKLKSQIKDICPILIKGSIEEAKREA